MIGINKHVAPLVFLSGATLFLLDWFFENCPLPRVLKNEKLKGGQCNLQSHWPSGLPLGIFYKLAKEKFCLIGYKFTSNNIYMVLNTNIITIITPTSLLSSPFYPPHLILYGMPRNQLAQNQPWIWNPTMEYSQDQKGSISYGRRDQMFEKPLTPSDVGKLNRLVIPKQYAEKYFPLDSESGEKGLLLSFEDEMGKLWKFRYSYWTSSQSYVLTKGWSRFVKEKRLDAGDVVVFERCHLGSSSSGSLYISCRRRGSGDHTSTSTGASTPQLYAAAAAPSAYPTPHFYMNSVSSVGDTGENAAGAVENTAAVATTKRLRLFGVNLECSEPQHLVSGTWRSQFLPANASTSQL